MPRQVITSPQTPLPYRIERLLGEGGFGQVYLATRLGRSPVVPAILCIKLIEIKRLREKGHRITLLDETQFWRLVGRR